MVTAQHASDFAIAPRGVEGNGPLDAIGHLLRIADVGFQGRRGVDAGFRDVDIEFDIVVFEGSRGGDDGGGAVARSATKGSGAVDGDRYQHR